MVKIDLCLQTLNEMEINKIVLTIKNRLGIMTQNESKFLDRIVDKCLLTVEENIDYIHNKEIHTYMERFIMLKTPKEYVDFISKNSDEITKKGNIRIRRRMNKNPLFNGLDVWISNNQILVFISEQLTKEV